VDGTKREQSQSPNEQQRGSSVPSSSSTTVVALEEPKRASAGRRRNGKKKRREEQKIHTTNNIAKVSPIEFARNRNSNNSNNGGDQSCTFGTLFVGAFLFVANNVTSDDLHAAQFALFGFPIALVGGQLWCTEE
jgi:hypothetical protein